MPPLRVINGRTMADDRDAVMAEGRRGMLVILQERRAAGASRVLTPRALVTMGLTAWEARELIAEAADPENAATYDFVATARLPRPGAI